MQNELKHNIRVQRLGQKAAEDVELEAVRRQSNYRVEVSMHSYLQCNYNNFLECNYNNFLQCNYNNALQCNYNNVLQL